MPGRYGTPERLSRHSRSRRSRPSRWFRVVGVGVGVALVSFGVVALVNAGDAAGEQETVASDAGSTIPGGSSPQLREDANDLSRSAYRRPGRLVHSLGKPTEQPSDQPTESTSSTTPTSAPDDTQATSAPDDKPTAKVESDPDVKPEASAPLPDKSGTGRRIVFDITGQQVWLVEEDGEVARTYPVSGSRYDQLPTGTYEVFSKSEEAVSWDFESTMRHMVRFHRGENSNIGFHDIPIYDSGKKAQTLSELGTPLSDGCIRQDPKDARALWDFAPVGTKVVVVRT